MGFQEIKEEVVSRKLLNYSEEIYSKKPIINEMLIGLSRKNFFLTEVSDYSESFGARELSIYLESLLDGKGSEQGQKLYYEDHFDRIINLSIDWVKTNVKKNKA